MGAGQSVPDQGKAPSRGLHILRVTPGSPASQTDIEPFFDFIIGYEDESRISQEASIEAHDFERVVEEHEGRRLQLVVWNSKAQSIRRKLEQFFSDSMSVSELRDVRRINISIWRVVAAPSAF